MPFAFSPHLRWSYDAYGRMTGYIDPSGLRVDFSHDSQDRLTEEVFHLEGGRTARRSYRHSVSGDVKTIIDELGNKTIEEYDMSGRLLIRSHYSSEGRTLFRESFSYDALGNRISVTDAAGSSTLTEYSERSRPVKVTGPEAEYFDGNQSCRTAARTRNEYSPAGHLIAEHSSSRRGGDTISMETDALGRVITETVHVRGEEGLTRKYTAKHFYDENGSRVRTVDPLGGETRTEYTPRGQKKSITDPDGHKTGFTYDALDRQTSVTGPRGSSGRYGENYTADLYYDDLDRLTRAVLPAIEPGGERGEVLFSYDARGNLLSRIEPDGSRTEYTYTARHWKSSETQIGRTLDGAVRSYTVRYTYNDIGQMTVRQEPGGERTRFEYDALGRKLKEILPDQSKRQYYWDMRGLLEAQVDGIGAVTRHSYDELGREVSMTDPEGHTSGYRYDQRGNIAQITDPSGESFTAWFDERGLVTRERDSRGREKRFGYDEAGRPVFLEDPRGTEITYTHTPAGLVESISYQNGGETHIQSFRYDEAGALMEANDNGVLTRYNEKDGEYVPNPYDLQTSVSETLGGKTLTSRYTYDIMKRRTSTGYSSGGKTEYLYNTLGRLERIPGIIDESINFDADGLAAGYELANGVRAEFEYDSRRRAVSVIHRDSSGSTGQSYRLTCDMEDNIIQRNGDHFSYDRSSQMTSTVLSGDASIEEYPLEDREFALGSIRSDVRADRPAEIPGGELTLDWGAGSLVIDLGYAYKTKTVIVRPRSINSRLRKPQLSLSTALYNMEGQYTEQPFGMETDEQTGEITFTLEYGVFTRFIKLHSHINALDAEGEPLMDPGSFDLDPESVRVYALSGGVNKFYSYKPDGGRAVHSALTDTMRSDRYSYYPDSDLVQIAGDYACRYDENGNMTEKGDRYTESGGEITIHKEGRYALYKYDLLNRLVSVSRLNGEGEVEVAASYRYSHRNLRIERTDKAGTVRYVFDLDGNIIEEHRGDELIRYVFRRGKHLAKITPDGTYYYGTDRLGSTTVMFDGEGSVVWRGDVSPFGELVSSEGSIEERVKFTGKDYDEAAGLYYFNARWYDAELGRFTTEDPARDGLNWYVYVRNNPLRFVDPTGLDAVADPEYLKNLEAQEYYANLEQNYLPTDADGNDITDISPYIQRDEEGKPYTDDKGAALFNEDGQKILGDEGWNVDAKDVFHEDLGGDPVVKLTNESGAEQIYNMNTGKLVTDPQNRGTWNKGAGPYGLKTSGGTGLGAGLKHLGDISKWKEFGIGPDDHSTPYGRAIRSVYGTMNPSGSSYRNLKNPEVSKPFVRGKDR